MYFESKQDVLRVERECGSSGKRVWFEWRLAVVGGELARGNMLVRVCNGREEVRKGVGR
jgi:hypothetical protein